MLGVQKMTTWRGKQIAGLKGKDLDDFRAYMEKAATRRAFAPSLPVPEPTETHAQTNLRGK